MFSSDIAETNWNWSNKKYDDRQTLALHVLQIRVIVTNIDELLDLLVSGKVICIEVIMEWSAHPSYPSIAHPLYSIHRHQYIGECTGADKQSNILSSLDFDDGVFENHWSDQILFIGMLPLHFLFRRDSCKREGFKTPGTETVRNEWMKQWFVVADLTTCGRRGVALHTTVCYFSSYWW